jgi:hypothetical protein
MPGGGGSSGFNRPVTVGEQAAVKRVPEAILETLRLIRPEGYWLWNPFLGIWVPMGQPGA